MAPLFIELTPQNDHFKFFVNPQHIEVMFQSGGNAGTMIHLSSSPSIHVRETPEEILRMIASKKATTADAAVVVN